MNDNKKNLLDVTLQNPKISKILKEVNLESEWYIGGGALCQTYWNYKTKRDLNYGINDFDILYFDNDLSKQKEELISDKLSKYFIKQNINIEAVNQCRAHLWYPEYFGNSIKPIINIDSLKFIPNYTCVCLWLSKNLELFAPFGVEDVVNLDLRYTGNTAIPAKFIKPKMDKWISKWPELNIIQNSFPKEIFIENII